MIRIEARCALACEARETAEDIEALNANIASAAKAVRENVDFLRAGGDIHLDFSPNHRAARDQKSGDGDCDGGAARCDAAFSSGRLDKKRKSVGAAVAPAFHESILRRATAMAR